MSLALSVSKISIGALVAAISVNAFSAESVHAAVVVEYNPVTAGAGVAPQDVPGWSLAGTASYWANNGTALIQNVPAGTGPSDAPATSITAPQTAGLMVRGGNNYSIEFTVRPLIDAAPGLDWYARNVVTWADDIQSYAVSLDKYTNDVDGNGRLGYASGYISTTATAISDIDWSVPNTIGISYVGGVTNSFDFFLNGVYQTTLGADAIRHNTTPHGPWQNTVTFGSPTTAGGAVHNEWHLIRISDTAIPIPEPTALGLLGAAGFMFVRRRR